MASNKIFIIDKKKNVLIFLGFLGKDIEINQQELSKVLGFISSHAINLKLNSSSKLQIDREFYFFGNFEKIIIIIQYLKKDHPPKELLIELNKMFMNRYSNILENYTINDIPKFKSFMEIIKRFLPRYLNKKSEEQNVLGAIPIIDPMKRITYHEGISPYKRDEVLWKEAKMVKDKYPADFIEGMIFYLQIYLKISPKHRYKVFIDFSDYPSKPTIGISKDLNKQLGKNLEELLYFYRNWNVITPPHIIEIISELEAILKKFENQGRLSDSNERFKSDFPEIKPLSEGSSLNNQK